jgi:hypothetical protein
MPTISLDEGAPVMSGLMQLVLEPLLDGRVLMIGFDLLDLQRDAKPLGEITFGNGGSCARSPLR